MQMKYEETYSELVRVKGIECEFFDVRIDKNSIPEGKHFYEMRHDEEDWGVPCQVQRGVLVNFFGTLVTDEELPLNEEGRLYLEESDFEYIFM